MHPFLLVGIKDHNVNIYLIFVLFVGKIEISGGLDNIVKQVKSEIASQQNMVMWEEED